MLLEAADLLQLGLQHQQATRAIQLHLQAEHESKVSWLGYAAAEKSQDSERLTLQPLMWLIRAD